MEAKDTLWYINWGDGDNTFVVAPDKETAKSRMVAGKGMVNYVVELDAIYQSIFKAGQESVRAIPEIGEVEFEVHPILDIPGRTTQGSRQAPDEKLREKIAIKIPRPNCWACGRCHSWDEVLSYGIIGCPYQCEIADQILALFPVVAPVNSPELNEAELRKEERDRIEKMFDDNGGHITFIRKRDNIAGVEDVI